MRTRGLTKKRLLAGLAAAALLAAVWIMAANGREEKPKAPADQGPAEVKVRVLRVEPRTIQDVLVLPGRTEAWRDLTLSAEKGGNVEWIGPTEGDAVKAGEPIAKIDLAALEAARNKAQAAFDLAEKQARRRTDLLALSVLSAEEMDKAETELAAARADLNQAEVDYRQGIVVSPINGVVNTLHVDPGEYVQPGTPVVELVDLSSIKINVSVPELDVRYLKKGAEAQIRIDAYPERVFAGTVEFAAFKADPATNTFLVRVVVGNKDLAVRPGMMARAAFVRREIKDALAAPLFAILDRGGERMLFVEKDGLARARTVELGVIDRDLIQIVKGLSPGENLIVSGQTEVEDGMRVSAQ